MDTEHQSSALLAPSPEYLATVKVFPLITSLKKDVIKTIDSALSWDQLTASDINFSIVRPIVSKYARLKNMAAVYACLVVRSYFLAQSEEDLAYAGVMVSRAMLCEILAMKLLNRFASNHIQLVAVLTTCWNPLAGAAQDVVEQIRLALGGDNSHMDSPQSALEMAISTQAKAFISSPVSQKVINDIYSGRIMFSMAGNRSMLEDNYKPRAIEVYDSRSAPFLDHYRLRVPRYGAIMDIFNFGLLLLTFILCLAKQDTAALTVWEIAFIVLASAFALKEYTASAEHGWIIYIANMWNAFDFSFIMVFLVYLCLRIKGLCNNDPSASIIAFDILACGACILFPRLAFFAVSNNVVILSLRAMISQFVFFIGIAAICFSGLLFTLWTLSKDGGPRENSWTMKSIAWLMVQIWFGNTYLSFAQATSFHPLFGPILMTGFAALSNTLLLTILISILSNTVARIDANATQEYLFQFAISTIQGSKSDALFSYQPPFNIVAFILLKPASWFLSPRSLHTANVFLIRSTSLPPLIIIGLYERYFAPGSKFRESGKSTTPSIFTSLPRHIKNIPFIEALVGSTSNDLYDAIFDVEVTQTSELFEDSDEDFPTTLRSVNSRDNVHVSPPPTPRRQPRPPSTTRSQAGHSLSRSRRGSPRPRLSSLLVSGEPIVPEVRIDDTQSPLALMFSQRASSEHPIVASAEASIRRVESALDDIRHMPIQRLKDEMKELQDRQARIENLLLMLTRGMRNETHRHDSTTP